jgi:hypothetical protein
VGISITGQKVQNSIPQMLYQVEFSAIVRILLHIVHQSLLHPLLVYASRLPCKFSHSASDRLPCAILA